MSRTIKDKPNRSGYLKGIKRNEDELSRAYLREKRSDSRTSKEAWSFCNDCGSPTHYHSGRCDDCPESSVEDLITLFERTGAA